MACRLPSFVPVHAHETTKRTKMTFIINVHVCKKLRFKIFERRNLNHGTQYMFLIRAYHGQLKLKCA